MAPAVRSPLEHERRLLAAIVESSDDAIISKDTSGIVTSWNQGAERIFGYSAEEMIGAPIAVLAVDGRADEMPAILRRVISGQRVDHFETTRRRKDGGIVHVSLSVSPIHDENGQVVGASKVARDITPARQAMEALRVVETRLRDQHRELLHAARLGEMGQMAATLAHEISQPLSAIVSYLQACELLLEDDTVESRARLREAVGRAARQASRAGEVVRRLRAFSKPHDEILAPVSMTQILEESVALAALGTGRRDVFLEMTPPTGPDLVVADKVEIQQVLLNLIRNAIEAMEGQSRQVVRLCARAGPDELEVAVGDTGPGLSLRARESLFQPFFTTKQDGMGIGLSICRKIISLHGGRLWAEDRSGGGTIFWFTLPRAKSI